MHAHMYVCFFMNAYVKWLSGSDSLTFSSASSTIESRVSSLLSPSLSPREGGLTGRGAVTETASLALSS